MNNELLDLLNYRGVLGVLASTSDGLVVGAAGLNNDDAEIVGAASSTLWSSLEESGDTSGSMPVSGGEIHLVIGEELALIALTEPNVPHQELADAMWERLERVVSVFT